MINVAEMRPEEVILMVNYFTQSDEAYLAGMGAAKHLMPDPQEWNQRVINEINKPDEEKGLFYVVWSVDGQKIGHSNINHIQYGEVANMHLHMWLPQIRRQGHGDVLIKKSIQIYQERFKLKRLLCEPFAGNPAPIKTLERNGFKFVERYETIPSTICEKQEVVRYELTF